MVALQALPQAPQFAVVVSRLVSQPLAALPSQSPKPTLQRSRTSPARRRWPGRSRGRGTRCRSRRSSRGRCGCRRSRPPQKVEARATDVAARAARAHHAGGAAVAAGAAVRALDVRVSVSQPFAPLPSQLPKPALQLATVHAEPAQPATPLATRAGRGRRRRSSTGWSAGRSRSRWPRSPSQSPKPALQLPTAHAPEAQAAVALGTLHARPQAPQCALVLVVLVSQPLAALPSQSPKPALHEATPQRAARAAGVAVGHARRHARRRRSSRSTCRCWSRSRWTPARRSCRSPSRR